MSTRIKTRCLVKQAFELARSLKIAKLLVKASSRSVIRLITEARQDEQVIWITQGDADIRLPKKDPAMDLEIPEPYRRTKSSEITMALFMAVMYGYLRAQDNTVCLTGEPRSRWLNMLLLTQPRDQLLWLRKHGMDCVHNGIPFITLGRILQIALQLASEGREGRPIGTIFVVGDLPQLNPYLKQLIINPCAGHPRKIRNIHNHGFVESLRELAALDGAFIVDRKGVVESAATYLDTRLQERKLPAGLGARHAAAAGITSRTDSMAVVVSASSRRVTRFSEGEVALELDVAVKPVAIHK